MNTRHDMWRPSRWANLHMSRFVSHPAGAELGGVGEIADTTKENQCAHTGAGEEPPSVAYESDAVRRLETMRGHGWRRAACKAAPSRPTGRVCLFKRELTKRAVCEAGRAGGRVPFRTSSREESGWGGVVAVTGNPCRNREKTATVAAAKRQQDKAATVAENGHEKARQKLPGGESYAAQCRTKNTDKRERRRSRC